MDRIYRIFAEPTKDRVVQIQTNLSETKTRLKSIESEIKIAEIDYANPPAFPPRLEDSISFGMMQEVYQYLLFDTNTEDTEKIKGFSRQLWPEFCDKAKHLGWAI